MALVALKPTQQVVDIVGALGGTWRGYLAMGPCPAHQDATPSLSIRQGHEGILVHCFAGCDPEDVPREISPIKPGQRYAPLPPCVPQVGPRWSGSGARRSRCQARLRSPT